MQKIFKADTINRTFFYLFAFVVFHLQTNIIFSQQNTPDINKIRTVVIDAGHGGKDSGALGAHSEEKNLALAIALKTGKYIEERLPGVKVIYTRTTDVFVPLYERAKIANDNNADLFISIHINSSPNPSATGSETLVLGLHRSDENFEVAKRENQVILLEDDYSVHYEGFDPNSEESYIMFSLMQYIYDEHSINFANDVQNQFRDRAGRKDRGVRRQGLLVLAQSAMPGVLIEAGFISNKNEERYLMSEKGQDYIASAIFRAFREYKNVMERTVTPIAEEDNPGGNNDDSLKPDPTKQSMQPEKSTNIKNPTIQLAKPDSTPNTPDSLVFKVQVLYSENRLDKSDEIYKDFNDVEEINIDGKYKYLVGSRANYTDAVEYSKLIKNHYPDAFIVAVSNGKIIPLSQALKVKAN